jgi:exopolysaccharide/PEP-CTERM locus tyrosine autokinase
MSKISEALDLIQGPRQSASPDNVDTAEANVIAKLASPANEQEPSFASNRTLHIDRAALRDAYLIPPEQDEQLIANQYRDIKRPLIAHAFGKRATQVERGNLIMVTSSIAGEGKTFTSINLAFSMARERDYTTLLVDADPVKPHISRIFGVENEIGLLDVLENPDLDVREAILPTDEKGLRILPAGKPRPSASELLSSEAMDDIVEMLCSTTDRQIVVLDAPPLLQTSEAKVLSRIAGQIVLVVRAEHTPREDVNAALSILNEDLAVNLLLNQGRFTSGKYQYGYGAGSHSSGQKSESEPNEEHRSEIFE